MAEHIIKLKDAVRVVPIFSGSGNEVSYTEFEVSCNEAKTMLPEAAETNLVKLICTKVVGSAKHLIRGETFVTVQGLLDRLSEYYRPPTTSQLIGELSEIRQFEEEDVPCFASRVKEITHNIIQTHKSNHQGQCPEDRKEEYTAQAARAFIVGLRSEISARITKTTQLEAAIKEAVDIELIMRRQLALRKLHEPLRHNLELTTKSYQIGKKHRYRGKRSRNVKTQDGCEVARTKHTCYRCNGVGHISRECPLNPRPKPVSRRGD